jgi:hypothetical protein
MQSKKITPVEQLHQFKTQVQTIQTNADALINQLNAEAAKLTTGVPGVEVEEAIDYVAVNALPKLIKLIGSLTDGNEHQQMAAFHYRIMEIYSEIANYLACPENISKVGEDILIFYWYFLMSSHPFKAAKPPKETIEECIQSVVDSYCRLDDDEFQDAVLKGNFFIQRMLIEEGYRYEAIEFSMKFLMCFIKR